MFRRRTVVQRRVGSPLLRTPIVGGAAYSAGKSAQRSSYREADQEQRLSQIEQQQAQSAPPTEPAYQAAPAGGGKEDRLGRLKTLGELRQAGVLTDAEFETEKQKILRS